MADWRFLARWGHRDVAARLERTRALPRNFDTRAELTAERGWNIIHSRALIACEPPGPPVRDGAYERVWHGLQRFHHSDPRIVIAHFRDDVPLAERRVLLELQALGLRFLCPATIGDRRDETGGASTLRGFSLETLAGHIERGREWFLLEKDHATGHVRFRIEAAWVPGEFPNWWSRRGFDVVGRRYQRAWHRLAHLRLRRLAAGLVPTETVGPGRVVHEESPMPTEPVQFFGQRGVGRWGVDVEEEEEEMGSNANLRAIGLGALSGLRSVGPAALLARSPGGRRGRPHGKQPGGAVALLALGEALADKLPSTPPRTRAVSLLARMALGAYVAGRATGRRAPKATTRLLGAAAAAVATFAGFRLRHLASRRGAGIGLAAAFAEDALVLWGGSRLAASAPS